MIHVGDSYTHRDLGHGLVASSGGSTVCGSGTRRCVLRSYEVILHLGVQLLSSLLVLSGTLGLLWTTAATATCGSGVLRSSGGLGLSLRLAA